MDSGVDGFSGPGPGTGTTRETVVRREEAAKPSPKSGELPAARRGPKRRVKAGADSPGSDDSRSGTGGPGRVLRDRTARGAVVAHKTSQSENDIVQKKPGNLLRRRRGRPDVTGLLSRPTDAMEDTTKKKPTAKKATLLLPKSSKGIQGPSARAPRSTPAPVCKTEPDTEATSCGVERGTLKGNIKKIAEEDVPLDEDPPFKDNPNDLIYKPGAKKEKSKRRPTLKQKKEKKSEKEDEENEIKKEESPMMAVKTEDEMGDDIEPPRKRGRRRKDDKTPRLPKRRKKPPVQYVRCEMEGCGTILAHPRYLQHHIKYQHLLKKKYVCNHPSCGRLFRLQKQLLRHAKHHTDQRDYICEFCARAFKSAHNLAVHRMIHTGEKPIQCEICGFTCRQKASLNWHMKKHDADTFYQFSCSICGKKFEKKDCVVAHKAKSHPEVLIAEALAANAGTLITTPAPVLEAVPGVMSPTQPSASQENQDALGGALTSLQQVVLPLVPQTQIDLSQGHLLQLAPHHMVQLRQEQETSALLHLTTATTSAAGHLSNTSHPQLIQLTTLPAATTTTSMAAAAAADSQSTLLTLSSVTTLSPAASLAQQAVEWVREADAQSAGDLWERVVQGRDQDVGEIMWEGDAERRKEDGGMVWEGERQIVLDGVEVHGDGLI